MTRFDSLADLPAAYREQAARKLGLITSSSSRAASKRVDPRSAPSLFRPCQHPTCHDLCSAEVTYEFHIPGRAITTNRLLSALFIRNPETRAARTAEVGRIYKEWKQAIYAQAVHDRVPTLRCVTITVQARYRRKPFPDAGGLTIVGKALVDGLVDSGVLPNDDGRFVLGEWYPAPVYNPDGDEVVLTVRAHSNSDSVQPE